MRAAHHDCCSLARSFTKMCTFYQSGVHGERRQLVVCSTEVTLREVRLSSEKLPRKSTTLSAAALNRPYTGNVQFNTQLSSMCSL